MFARIYGRGLLYFFSSKREFEVLQVHWVDCTNISLFGTMLYIDLVIRVEEAFCQLVRSYRVLGELLN